MKWRARLPKDREKEGTLDVIGDDGEVALDPVRCRGEADNTGAARHGNVHEDPTKAYGDHPSGRYRVVQVIRDPQPRRSYGPAFIRLEGIEGEALQAKANGREGIGIHGGDPGPGGILRVTYGCLRVENAIAEVLAALAEMELADGRQLDYECALF